MGSCCSPKPDDALAREAQDLTNQSWSQFVWAANYVALAVGWLVPSWRPFLWTAGLAAAGVLCIVNASRCGRLHCHITGPLFLIGAVLTVLKATGVVSVSWNVLGITIILGTAIAYAPEFLLGKYVRRSQGTEGVEQ